MCEAIANPCVAMVASSATESEAVRYWVSHQQDLATTLGDVQSALQAR